MRHFIWQPLLVSMLLPVTMLALAVAEASDSSWTVTASPYRLRLELDHSVSGPAVINVGTQSIVDRVAQIAVDQVNQETFAFEKAVLVNPRTGRIAGRFQLVRVDAPLDIDGSFADLQTGKSPWTGFAPDKMTLSTVELGGESHRALMIKEDRILNAKVYQSVQLTPGQRYLLEYWIMMDAQDNEMGVMLNDPSRTLFAQLPHSYYNKMPPRGEWAHRRVIFRPQVDRAQLEVRPETMDASLEVSHAFVGRGGVADLRLQPVAWRMVVDPDEPTDALELYAIARAGHRLTVPTDALLAADLPGAVVTAELGEAEVQPLNHDSALVAHGKTTAWTIDPALPLKVGLIRGYQPTASQAAAAARVDVFRGGSSSLVIAVDAGAPRLDELEVRSDLPAEVSFHRLATVPVYDGPTVDGQAKGRLLETRYEPMVPLGFALDPDSTDGLHVVLATITPREDTPLGVQHGKITLRFAGQQLEVPVQLNVAPLTLAPKRHFGTLFGAISFLIGYEKGVAGMVADTVSVAAFHGLDDEGLAPEIIMSLSIPDAPDDRTREVRALAERYFHVLLDHHLLPQSPALYAYFSYHVIERGEGLAPELTDWDFSQGFDEAIEEFVVGRDMPWLMIGRTNGHLINRITLNNGKTYSIDPKPGDPAWVHLSREQFDRLVGDYWDRFAAHLDELGVLDRALFVIDESGTETYDNIYAYVMAMKSQPYASQIKIGHTIQKTSTWTRRLPNGKLLMDEVLDVPMPINDEHYNFFEPEWHARFERPGKISWVYNVESDHISLENAGLSTLLMPLKLQHLGVQGWYDWECFTWSMPYGYRKGDMGGFKYVLGPVMNPWVNPFYHHGPGVLSFFYPPDPRGPASEPTDLVIPSYRLTLMRDGIQQRALLDALRTGRDDAGSPLRTDADRLDRVEKNLASLWSDNPVQWYLDYTHYRQARRQLFDLAMDSANP